MRKALLLVVIAGLLPCACEDKKPAPKPAAPAPASSTTPPAAAKPTGDVAAGDTIDIVFAKWNKPEVFKFDMQGDAMMYEFSQMPAGLSPEGVLTFYYLPRKKAILFKFNGKTEEVVSVSDISASELDMVQATAKRNIPDPPAKPAGGP